MITETDKKTEKKIKILEAAYQLFQTKTVGATAVDDVVKAAGIARGTFYLYFRDKTDLLDQIIFFKSAQSMKELMRELIKKTQTESLSFAQICRLFITMYIDFLCAHKDILTVVEKNLSACMKLYPSFYDEEARLLFDELLSLFVQNGYTPQLAYKTIYIAVDMIGSVCSDAILVEKPFSLPQIRAEVTDAAVHMILGAVTNHDKGESV